MTSFGYEIMLPRGFWFQTLDVNKPWRQIPADRLLFFFFFFFFWCSHIFLSDYPKAIRRGEISFKSNHVIERNFESTNSRITGTSSDQLYKPYLCLGNFPKHVLPNPCYIANAPRQYPVPLPCTPHCISAVCFGEHMFNSRRSDLTCRTLRILRTLYKFLKLWGMLRKWQLTILIIDLFWGYHNHCHHNGDYKLMNFGCFIIIIIIILL